MAADLFIVRYQHEESEQGRESPRTEQLRINREPPKLATAQSMCQNFPVERRHHPNLRSVAQIGQTFAISDYRSILRRIRELVTELAPHLESDLTQDESVDLGRGGTNVGYISPVGTAPGQTSLDVVKGLETCNVPYDMDSHEGLRSAVRAALIWLGEI